MSKLHPKQFDEVLTIIGIGKANHKPEDFDYVKFRFELDGWYYYLAWDEKSKQYERSIFRTKKENAGEEE